MINFAHRGASRYYPENTILSLKEGIKVIRISSEICNNKDIVDLNNWTKIYEYIGELDETE